MSGRPVNHNEGNASGVKPAPKAVGTGRTHFDGDQRLSPWMATVTQDTAMFAEINQRRGLVSRLSHMAIAMEGDGYRHAAALLLQASYNIECALIDDGQ